MVIGLITLTDPPNWLRVATKFDCWLLSSPDCWVFAGKNSWIEEQNLPLERGIRDIDPEEWVSAMFSC